ncbi:hypothetical protein N0V93_001975 [Gnomoniopsis smithogilvyi]|uniref:Uncharacterized protein n=1 Tax=Gnomoniopsis smithogilvyi TaxID=1191159 RepID=A0A9W8Z4Q4_9PEZI|nr:hypothetical protein N0V93_001975 [Gnomoniopsis smithogilvyi]
MVVSSTPGIIDGSTPGIIIGSTPGIVGSLPTKSSVLTGVTSTLTGSFPSMSGVTTAVISATSSSSRTTITIVPTDASMISLSSGIGPLLSSSLAMTSSSSSEMTPSVSADTAATTTIGIVSETFAPTAAYSDLTTSGVPESLSVNLSLFSSISGFQSSAALISFGTSSPAVLSTVLPSGVSMGTSSQILTTYSTITLGSASLTGVTLLAPRSPTSCFTLPTPAASLDLIAVAVVPQDDYNLNNPMIFAFGDNGTTPRYVSAMARGNPYVLNLSPGNTIKGQLGLQIPGEDALVFDGSGLSLYTGNCSALTQVLVDNFYAQLGSMAGTFSRPASVPVVSKRQSSSSSTFTVEVAVDAYLKTPSFSPNLTFGDSECALQSNNMGSETNNITWTCSYPPTTGGVASCEANVDSWLSDMSAPSTTPGNTTEVLATVSPFLLLSGESILDLFPGSDPALALGFTFMQQAEKAAKQAIGSVGPAACEVIHAFDSDDLVLEDDGPLGTQTLGSYMTAPPPSLAVNLAAIATALIVNVPRRKVNPTDNFLKQIATNFKSILGAFTHWLGGLGSHTTLGIPGLGGIGGFQETTLLRLTDPITAVISTTTLASPSMVPFTPTMTVTHILGDGWFNPSTYIVGPDANTAPRFPAMGSSGFDSKQLSIGTASISLEEYDFPVASSTPTYASSNIVDHLVATLAAMKTVHDGPQTDRHWDMTDDPPLETGTITSGASSNIHGPFIVVTTTLTFLGGGQLE